MSNFLNFVIDQRRVRKIKAAVTVTAHYDITERRRLSLVYFITQTLSSMDHRNVAGTALIRDGAEQLSLSFVAIMM